MQRSVKERLSLAGLFLGVVVLAGAWVVPLADAQRVPPGVPTLTAVKVTAPPKLDGSDADEAWKKASALEVTVAGGTMGFAVVTLKAVYTTREIYLLAKWPDKTMNIEHHPYTYDGTKWTKPDGPMEDRFAIQWNISVANFERGSCALLCHSGDRYPDKLPRMHTNAPGEFTDEWHWKAGRSNPMGYVDDKYVDNAVDPKDDEAGHHADGGVRVYTGNKLKDGAPSFVWRGPSVSTPPGVSADLAKLFLLDTDKAPYGPINPLTGKPWAKADKVPVAILQVPTESNADIKVAGVWKDGAWTLEMARALDTKASAVKGNKKIDVVFDSSKVYFFGISVFDNTEAVNHAFAGSPVALIFKK
jgi:hypothetical protein